MDQLHETESMAKDNRPKGFLKLVGLVEVYLS